MEGSGGEQHAVERSGTHAVSAARRHAILDHASPVLGSGLGEIGQAVDPGVVTRAKPGPPGRGPGRPGAQGAGRSAGCEALVSAPERPCQPCTCPPII